MVPFHHLPIDAPPWKATERRRGRRRYQGLRRTNFPWTLTRLRVFAFPFSKAGLNTRWDSKAGSGRKQVDR
jgi:hypothetical protein